jgi:hypothetical protein
MQFGGAGFEIGVAERALSLGRRPAPHGVSRRTTSTNFHFAKRLSLTSTRKSGDVASSLSICFIAMKLVLGAV